MWTHRQLQIIEYLLKNPDGMKGYTLAESLGVSARTIRNDINRLNDSIKKLGALISASTTSGYYIKNEHVPLVTSLLQTAQISGSGDEAADRRYRLAGEILFHGAQNLNDLAEKIYVSPQTIYKDLQRLQKDLGEDTFAVSHDQVFISQDEQECRKIFLLLMKDECVRCHNIAQTRLTSVLGEHYDASQFKALTCQIKERFLDKNLILSDSCLFLIVWAVFFSIVRNRFGFTLPDLVKNLRTHSKITGLLQQLIHEDDGFREADIAFLDNFMWTLKLFDNGGEATSTVSKLIFDEFCVAARRSYGIDFSENIELCHKIEIHIDYMLRRLQEGYEMDNPVRNLIKEKYAYAYEIAMLAVPIVFRHCGRYLIDGEVSYLAIYVEHYLETESRAIHAVVVSGFSPSITELVRLWLIKHFPRRLEIVDVVPYHHLQTALTLPERNIEIVISLTEMQGECPLPVHVIDNLPGQNDFQKIAEMLNKMLAGRRFESAVKRCFSNKLILFEDEPKDFPSVIHTLTHMLQEAGNIDDAQAFARDVLEREVNYPTFLSNSFMIPHPLTAFAKQTAVAAAVLRKPIRHQDKTVRMIFLLAIEAKIDPEVSDLFTLFKLIAPDKNAFDRLIACENPQDFLKELSAISLAAYRNM